MSWLGITNLHYIWDMGHDVTILCLHVLQTGQYQKRASGGVCIPNLTVISYMSGDFANFASNVICVFFL